VIRFVIDEQLPPALARWLSDRGHQAEHVSDRLLGSAPDSAIWDYALEVSAAIVTKDEDFAQRRMRSTQGPAVVWVRLPNTRKHELLTWFETIMPHVLGALARGETLVEVT
jgi:predicted nuclease of predicted toxin-antitoxin system